MNGVLDDRAAQPAKHAVQVYREPEELAEAVAATLAAGFDAGEPAAVVANHRHWGLVTESLERRGWSLERLAAAGRLLVPADAHATLAALMVDDTISPERFDEVINALLDRAASRAPHRRVRVFGEMVDILAQRGDIAGAAALERLWNDLLARREFTLLCGYRLDIFDRETQVGTLPHVCNSHDHVRVVADHARLEQAVDAALEQVLGPTQAGRVYALAATQSPERLPLAQLALMWVSNEMPALAERVLAVARAQYARAASAPAG